MTASQNSRHSLDLIYVIRSKALSMFDHLNDIIVESTITFDSSLPFIDELDDGAWHVLLTFLSHLLKVVLRIYWTRDHLVGWFVFRAFRVVYLLVEFRFCCDTLSEISLTGDTDVTGNA